ncbi:MAG: glycosyl transferase [Gemmataceae bacterium]|nr:glycosyl transferase [Gemmataceae bacterium]
MPAFVSVNGRHSRPYNMIPTVSVVMAAKNYARFLPAAVESVRAQTFPDWELLVIDDGSTDHTPEAVRPFLADRRVRYVRSDRLGQSRAKNLGIGLSRGAYVAFLDADDAWRPTKLEKQVALFREQPDTGVVFCRRSLIDETDRPLPPKSTTPPQRGHVLSAMYVQNFVCFSSVIVRRAVFDHVGGFDPQWDLAIDYDLWLRVAKHHRFDFVDEELVLYRTGHGNLSKKLSDRVATAFSIMHRAGTRYGVNEAIPAAVVAEGYASTCRTVGYVMRAPEPATAARWYLRGLRWPNGRKASAKGLVAAVLGMLRRKRVGGSAENASENI